MIELQPFTLDDAEVLISKIKKMKECFSLPAPCIGFLLPLTS